MTNARKLRSRVSWKSLKHGSEAEPERRRSGLGQQVIDRGDRLQRFSNALRLLATKRAEIIEVCAN
jgi:hypothetical protein